MLITLQRLPVSKPFVITWTCNSLKSVLVSRRSRRTRVLLIGVDASAKNEKVSKHISQRQHLYRLRFSQSMNPPGWKSSAAEIKKVIIDPGQERFKLWYWLQDTLGVQRQMGATWLRSLRTRFIAFVLVCQPQAPIFTIPGAIKMHKTSLEISFSWVTFRTLFKPRASCLRLVIGWRVAGQTCAMRRGYIGYILQHPKLGPSLLPLHVSKFIYIKHRCPSWYWRQRPHV